MASREHSPEEFFSKHASDYAKSESHAHGSDLVRLIEVLGPRPSEVALDLATGTGFTAMELSSKVKQVIATDITQEMLAEAQKLARERGIRNIRFEKADACDLPYENSCFDLVTSRRAPHHFRDVSKFLREARRVMRPGGRLGIADMTPLEGCEDFFNAIERLRDATHVRALSSAEWKSHIRDANLQVISETTVSEPITFDRWLSPVRTGGTEEVAIRKEWDKAPQNVRDMLGLREKDGHVEGWMRTWIVLVASRQLPSDLANSSCISETSVQWEITPLYA